MKLNIAYTTDENYAQHTYISLTSLLEHNKTFKEIDVYLITEKLTPNTKKIFKNLANKFNRNIMFIDLFKLGGPELNLVEDYKGTKGTYCKLFFSRIKNVEKILFLDSDSVVVGSLEDLWNIDMTNFDIAGVVMCRTNINNVKIENRTYFNGGFIVINLKRWRENNIESKFIDFMKFNKEKLQSADELILNFVIPLNNVYALPLQYNLISDFIFFDALQLNKICKSPNFYSESDLSYANKKPIFIHYISGIYNRPWNKECDHPYKKTYRDYLKKTIWDGNLGNKKLSRSVKVTKFVFEHFPFHIAIFLRAIKMSIRGK
ncbi:glycosyltransferase family 8 protein [Clostridium estertheticum]|nr:glycosyltransferase family 8 protein [Clostridium estertheticum]